MAPLDPESARAVLARVDPGRSFQGWPVGLRDGAILALAAAGFKPVELVALRASGITMARGRVVVTVRRRGATRSAVLPDKLGAWVLAWYNDRRLGDSTEPVFTGPGGPLSRRGIAEVLNRYRRNQRRR
jgi:site-specific recombinase XerC